MTVLVSAVPIARAGDVTDAVPADAMVVVAGRPLVHLSSALPAGSQPDMQGLLPQLLQLAGQLKLLPPEARALGDIAGCLPLLGRYPYAFVLLDITARRLPSGGHRLARMQAAIVFETDGDHQAIVQRIRQLLATYTDNEVSRLDKVPAAGMRYRLADSRLPDWAVVEWGTIGRRFAVSIGEGSFDRMLAVQAGTAAPLSRDDWYVAARNAAGVERAFVECGVAIARMRARLRDVLGPRFDRVLQGLGNERLNRLHVFVGTEDRAVRAHLLIDADGVNHHIVLSEPLPGDDPLASLVPPEARRYGHARQPLAAWVRGLRDAYLRSRGESTARELHEAWARMEEEYGFDADRDLLGHLGNRLIVHDFPLHPLHVPLLWTYLIEIDGADAEVRRAVDGIMRAWRACVADATASAPAAGLAPQIRRTRDGIWYVQVGLAGPAITVTPRWIVIGFSPEAVRENLSRIPGATSRPTGGG